MGILLFNWIGYQVLYDYLLQQSDRQLESRLDQNQYDEEELVAITLPLHMPYYSDQSDYQRIDGEININGVQYKYVKRRVHADSVTLLCIPDQQRMKLKEERNNYFKSVVGLQRSGKSKDQRISFKSFLSEYTEKQQYWKPAVFLHATQGYLPASEKAYSFIFISSQEHPPQNTLV